MMKRKDKSLPLELTEWKTAKEQLQDRLLWQHAVNAAIKKMLIFQGVAMQNRPLN
jgi:hypothetical protein